MTDTKSPAKEAEKPAAPPPEVLVEFQSNWFAPNGQRYRKRNGRQLVSGALVDALPTTATVYDATGKLIREGTRAGSAVPATKVAAA